MGFFSYFLGRAIRETAKDVSNKAQQVATGTANAVTQGVTSFVGTTYALSGTLSEYVVNSVRGSHRQQIVEDARRRQDVRKYGMPAEALTPEMLRNLEKLKACKTDIREAIIVLEEDIEELRSSVFLFAHGKKIQLKQKKIAELEKVHKATSLQELKELAKVAVKDKDVIAGHHSRTEELLKRLIKTDLSTAANNEILPQDNPLTSQRVSRP